MLDLLAEKENKIKSLKLELRLMKKVLAKNEKELLLVKGRNFEINQ